MDSKKLRETESSVLDVYTRVNPSYRPIEDDSDIFSRMEKMRIQLFNRYLKIPQKLFNNSSVLSLGCGTGEYETFYAKWGAYLTCVEINPISVSRLKKLFHKFSFESNLVDVICSSYFDVDFDDRYDFVITDGSVVHTEDPLGALKKFSQYVKKDGLFMFSFAELSGMFQRNIQRYILYSLSDGDESKIVEYSKILFREHLDRSVAIGKRSEESIIYDTYVNPKIKTPSLLDIFSLMDDLGFELYSMYPLGHPLGFSESFREIQEAFSSPKNIHMYLLSQINWLLSADTNEKLSSSTFAPWIEIMNDYEAFTKSFYDVTSESTDLSMLNNGISSLEKIAKSNVSATLHDFYDTRLKLLLADLKKIQACLLNKDINQLKNIDYDVLFKGCCGVGTNYFVFQHKLFQ